MRAQFPLCTAYRLYFRVWEIGSPVLPSLFLNEITPSYNSEIHLMDSNRGTIAREKITHVLYEIDLR